MNYKLLIDYAINAWLEWYEADKVVPHHATGAVEEADKSRLQDLADAKLHTLQEALTACARAGVVNRIQGTDPNFVLDLVWNIQRSPLIGTAYLDRVYPPKHFIVVHWPG